MTKLSNEQILSCITEVKRGNTPMGLHVLATAVGQTHHTKAKAWYGYCLAREKNDFSTGIALCKEALNINPYDADAYLALGRIFLLLNRREKAIETLIQGVKMDHSQDIERLLKVIGVRHQPVFPFFKRRNPLNVVSGRLFSRIGLRKAI